MFVDIEVCLHWCCQEDSAYLTASTELRTRSLNPAANTLEKFNKSDDELQMAMASIYWSFHSLILFYRHHYPLLCKKAANDTYKNIKLYEKARIEHTVYKYWLMQRATLNNNAPKLCNVARGPKVRGYIAQLRGIIFQCWSRLTVNICFVISQNKCNMFVSSSVTQQLRILIDPPNTVVGPKSRHKCMAWPSLHHVPREHWSRLFSRNMMLHWRNWATLFIFAHHVTCVGPIVIA